MRKVIKKEVAKDSDHCTNESHILRHIVKGAKGKFGWCEICRKNRFIEQSKETVNE